METPANTIAATPERIAELKRDMRNAVRAFRIAEADEICHHLIDDCGVDAEADDMLPSRVTIDVLSGRIHDAMCMLNGLGEDRGLGLKAVCLRLMGDPFWEGTAVQAQATTDDPVLKQSMQLLLDTADQA